MARTGIARTGETPLIGLIVQAFEALILNGDDEQAGNIFCHYVKAAIRWRISALTRKPAS